MGNGSEQQLQKELEDVLMDPSVADQVLSGGGGGWGDQVGGGDHVSQPTTAVLPQSMPQPCPDPLSDPLNTLPKVEMVLPVQSAQGAQESELNERSYRGESEQGYQINPFTGGTFWLKGHIRVLKFNRFSFYGFVCQNLFAVQKKGSYWKIYRSIMICTWLSIYF